MERPTAIIIHQYIDPVRYTSVGTLNNVDADSELAANDMAMGKMPIVFLPIRYSYVELLTPRHA